MSTRRVVVAKAFQDKPWLVRARVPRDPYVENSIQLSRTVNVEKKFKKILTAKAAREKDIEIDPAYKDEEKVDVEWTEIIPTVINWGEKRLVPRHSVQGNHQVIRQELFEAAKDPLGYIFHDRLIQLIEDEIEQWKSQDMSGQKIHPLVLVFMSHDGEGNAAARDVFYIKSYQSDSMVVSNSEDQDFEILFEKDVLKSGLTRRFALFLPENVHLVETNSDEILL